MPFLVFLVRLKAAFPYMKSKKMDSVKKAPLALSWASKRWTGEDN